MADMVVWRHHVAAVAITHYETVGATRSNAALFRSILLARFLFSYLRFGQLQLVFPKRLAEPNLDWIMTVSQRQDKERLVCAHHQPGSTLPSVHRKADLRL